MGPGAGTKAKPLPGANIGFADRRWIREDRRVRSNAKVDCEGTIMVLTVKLTRYAKKRLDGNGNGRYRQKSTKMTEEIDTELKPDGRE